MQHGTAFRGFKDLIRRTASNEILCNKKAFDIAKNTSYDGYQTALASMVHNNFNKKTVLSKMKIGLTCC